MGQHKSNPNCQLAKDGLLPPKKKPLGKRESERIIKRELHRQMGVDSIYAALAGVKQTAERPVMVHGAMKYHCESCGRSWWMFLEKGIEEFGDDHKPSPFTIRCACGGHARDISGICKLPEGGYRPLPAGEGYFANRESSDCGVPILPKGLRTE